MRRLAVLGVPGPDRDIVAVLIAARLGVPHVTMHAVFRAEFEAGTPAAAEAEGRPAGASHLPWVVDPDGFSGAVLGDPRR